MLNGYKCFEPGRKSPVLFMLVVFIYKSNHFILEKDRGYIYIFTAIWLVSIPLRGLSQSTISVTISNYYHLYPQLLHSNCERAVLLSTPNAHPWTAFFMPDILLMLGDWHVGHLGMLSE